MAPTPCGRLLPSTCSQLLPMRSFCRVQVGCPWPSQAARDSPVASARAWKCWRLSRWCLEVLATLPGSDWKRLEGLPPHERQMPKRAKRGLVVLVVASTVVCECHLRQGGTGSGVGRGKQRPDSEKVRSAWQQPSRRSPSPPPLLTLSCSVSGATFARGTHPMSPSLPEVCVRIRVNASGRGRARDGLASFRHPVPASVRGPGCRVGCPNARVADRFGPT